MKRIKVTYKAFDRVFVDRFSLYAPFIYVHYTLNKRCKTYCIINIETT